MAMYFTNLRNAITTYKLMILPRILLIALLTLGISTVPARSPPEKQNNYLISINAVIK